MAAAIVLSLVVAPALRLTSAQKYVEIKDICGSWGSRVASDTINDDKLDSPFDAQP